MIDENIDRTSVDGDYPVENKHPVYKNGQRIEGSGKEDLKYWGPNQMIDIILTRYQKFENGSIYDSV